MKIGFFSFFHGVLSGFFFKGDIGVRKHGLFVEMVMDEVGLTNQGEPSRTSESSSCEGFAMQWRL